MKWPFENDTSNFIKKLAKKDIISNRIFFIFNIFTVSLSIALISGITLFQQYHRINEENILNKMQQVTISLLNNKQINILKKESIVEDLIAHKSSNILKFNDIKLKAVYMPKTSKYIESYKLTSGHYPIKYNEIVLDKNILEKSNANLDIGDSITIQTEKNKKENFTITGFSNINQNDNFYFYVSKKYADKSNLLSSIPYSALIRIKNAKNMSLIDFENTVYKLALHQNISRNQIYFNSKFCSSLINSSGNFGIILSIFFIAISSSIVVYSIFYLSISNQVYKIGQLKTIGMTKPQIKKLIRIEGLYICIIGCVIGVPIGFAFAYLLEPTGFNFIITLTTVSFSIILELIIVQISIFKPVKIASCISPIEAQNYSINSNNYAIKKRHLKLSPYSIAIFNEFNNKKKHNLTVISLVIGGILFMIGSTFISSWNPESFIRIGNLEKGEYHIAFNHNTLINPKPYGISEYQINNPFSKKLLKELNSFPEVRKIYINKRTAAIIEYNGINLEIPIVPITSNTKNEVLCSLSSNLTYSDLTKYNSIVILGTDVQNDVYHTCPSAGEYVTLKWFDGNKHSTKVKIAGTTKKSMNEGFYLTNESIKKLWGDMNLISSITISTKNHAPNTSLEKKLNKILLNYPNLAMETLQENRTTAENTINDIKIKVYGLSIFIILFSVFSLVNTLINRISIRKKEFAILESICMTKKQIKRMLLFESLFLIVPSLIIVLLIGSLLGYILIKLLYLNGLYYFKYVFPIIPFVIYSIFLILISVIISSLCLKFQQRDTLVIRMKN